MEVVHPTVLLINPLLNFMFDFICPDSSGAIRLSSNWEARSGRQDDSEYSWVKTHAVILRLQRCMITNITNTNWIVNYST